VYTDERTPLSLEKRQMLLSHTDERVFLTKTGFVDGPIRAMVRKALTLVLKIKSIFTTIK
jgi:hypothetical protein